MDGKPPHVVTTFDSSKFLNPQDVKQYLYKLTPKDEKGRTANTIGKLDIIWKTTMGERGRLQTSQLPRKVPTYPDIEVDMTSSPEEIRLEEPFTLGISITNNTTSVVSLRLFFIKSKMGHMSYVGPSSLPLGEIRPQQKRLLDLKVFCLWFPLFVLIHPSCSLLLLSSSFFLFLESLSCFPWPQACRRLEGSG